ncbi:MAG: hypothetical protein OEY56_12995 [Cyclobacteriaceae bacterium]|nr:hypothetical protein [Cyclobacteriaceae bacterium]
MKNKRWPLLRSNYDINGTGRAAMFCLSFFMWGLAFRSQAQQYSFRVVIPSSSVIIAGSTTINEFECELIAYSANNPVMVKSIFQKDQILFKGLELAYPVDGFDCGVPLMNHDFQHFLTSTDHPYILLELKKIIINREHSQMEKVSVESEVTISLSGRKRDHVIRNGFVINQSDTQMVLTGYDNIRFSDFQLTPPSRFFGTVTVSDDLTIRFEIEMRVQKIP